MGFFSKIGSLLSNAPTLAAAAAPGIGSFLGQESANAANAQQVSSQMGFQKEMSDTAHQREATDLSKAGLNRILSLGAGASTPGGASATMQNSLAGMGAFGTSAMDYKRLSQDVKQSDEQIALTKQQQKTQETQQQLNTAQTAKAHTDQQIAEAEREDIQNTTDARTGKTLMLVENGKAKEIPAASSYYQNKANAENQSYSAQSSSAKAQKLRSDFDQKAANFDNYNRRIGETIGNITNAASAGVTTGLKILKHNSKRERAIRNLGEIKD